MSVDVGLIKSLASTLLLEIDTLGKYEDVLHDSFNFSEAVREFEVKLIKAALLKSRGNQKRAASLLGIKYTTLHNKIKHYKISVYRDFVSV